MQAWNLASPVAEPYREFADRWGNEEFSKYVDILEQQADEAMQDADQVHSFAQRIGVLQGHVNTSVVLKCLQGLVQLMLAPCYMAYDTVILLKAQFQVTRPSCHCVGCLPHLSGS